MAGCLFGSLFHVLFSACKLLLQPETWHFSSCWSCLKARSHCQKGILIREGFFPPYCSEQTVTVIKMDAWGLLNIAEASVLRCTTIFPLDVLKPPPGENVTFCSFSWSKILINLKLLIHEIVFLAVFLADECGANSRTIKDLKWIEMTGMGWAEINNINTSRKFMSTTTIVTGCWQCTSCETMTFKECADQYKSIPFLVCVRNWTTS